MISSAMQKSFWTELICRFSAHAPSNNFLGLLGVMLGLHDLCERLCPFTTYHRTMSETNFPPEGQQSDNGSDASAARVLVCHHTSCAIKPLISPVWAAQPRPLHIFVHLSVSSR